MVDPSSGEEILSYDHANIQDHSYKELAHREHQELQKYAIQEDGAGNQQHAWEVNNPADYDIDDSMKDLDLRPENDEEYEQANIEEICETVFSQIPQREYNQMTMWAAEYLPEDFIRPFNQVMSSGDPDEIYAAINKLINIYQEYN